MVTNTAPTFILRNGLTVVDVRDINGQENLQAASCLTEQSDGKLILAGMNDLSGSDTNVGVIRLNTDGTLDTSFSGDGKLLLDVGAIRLRDTVSSVALQGDGKLVLAGSSQVDSNHSMFSIVRLNTDGTPDTSFSGDGSFLMDGGGIPGWASSLIVQSDGKLLIAGTGVDGSGKDCICVVRLNTDGTPDTSFGGNGIATITAEQTNHSVSGSSAVLQRDGKLVVTGNSFDSNGNSRIHLVRLNTDGTTDTSFSSDGRLTLDPGASNTAEWASSVAVQSDGKLVVSGSGVDNISSQVDFTLIRVNADGTPDFSFSDDGRVTLALSIHDENWDSSLGLQPDGKLVLAGNTGIARFNADGSLDPTFSSDGIASVHGDKGGVRILANGKIVVGGGALNFTAMRINADGTLDSAFGHDYRSGIATSSLNGVAYFIEESAPRVLDASVRLTDAELSGLDSGAGNYAGASITLARAGGASAQDVFSGSGNLSFSGSNVVLSGISIGTLVAHTGGTLSIGFNANANQARLNEALSSIAYTNTGKGSALPASVQIAWTFSDGNTGAQGAGAAMDTTGITTVHITATGQPILGTSGSDIFSGTANADTLSGLDGNDTLNGGAGADSLDGGSGVDTASYADATTPVSVILYGGQAFGVSSGNDTLTAIENILGTAYSDLIYGDAADNVLDGGAGNDTLDGALGNDTLLGQTGDDLLNGLAGNDSLDGGDGNDTLFGWADNDTLVGGTGTDRLFGGAGNDHLSGGAGDDRLEGDDGDDGISGDSGNDTLRGWNGKDSLNGGNGNNVIYGGAGADRLDGGADNDQLEGDDGDDYILGGAGNDTLRGWNDNDRLDGGDADDAVFGGAGADDMVGGTGADTLEGDDGDDTIIGGTGNDTLRGWNDSDRLSGGDGDDLLVGWSGNDSMKGELGNDQLFGDDGADTLAGGAGGDVLQGGLGNDLYVFDAAFGFDGVRDYDYTVGNSDTFQFNGVNLAELSFARVGDALKVERTASAGADVITVNDWYQAGSNGAFRIETWIMGASTFSAAQIEALVVG